MASPGDTQANTDGGDQYTGLDRFGRVIDQNWVKTSTGTSTDRFQYGYDRAGDRLYQANLVDAALSELYHANSAFYNDSNSAYDPLGRLTGFARGLLSKSGNNGSQLDTINDPSTSESWQLDALGNIAGETTNGTTVQRAFNADNQNKAASPGTAPPAFDRNGNTVGDNNQVLVYDAWNQLVGVYDGGGPKIAGYSYDAQGWRITEKGIQLTRLG